MANASMSIAERVEELAKELRWYGQHDGHSTDTHVRMCAAIHRAADAIEAQAREIAWLRDEGRQKYSQGYMAACGRAERAEARCAELERERDTWKAAAEDTHDDYLQSEAENAVLQWNLGRTPHRA